MRCFFLISIAIIALGAPARGQSDSTAAPPTTTVMQPLKPKRPPMGALLRSMAVPGWGQFYNRKYIKGAVVCGVETFFIVRAIHWWRKTEDQYDKVLTVPEAEQAREFSRYLDFRSTRNDYLWTTGISVFLSMFDAYVDAHLAGLDVDLTPDFQPQTGASLHLRLRF